ncbi:MAG: nucleotide pyrophosphatase/phosphodiesterase family protein [Planctomycetota bacterium]
MKLLVINTVGLRPKDLTLAPSIAALGDQGFCAPLETVFPAVTCTVQASWLTGLLPRDHGVVANGWYFRDLAEVWLWRQSNHLVQGEKFYEKARRADPSFRCAKLFWWYNMYAQVSQSVTPRPEYYANGLKRPGLYSEPPELQDRLQQRLGDFPLFHFWGPAADLRSTTWIADAALDVMQSDDPDLCLVYLPHLDYSHQRFGPDDPRSQDAVRELDREVGRLADEARARGAHVIVLSEYGIEPVRDVVFPNRLLHQRGFLRVQERSHGQLLDAGASRAFAVADHQVAHVYVRDAGDLSAVRRLFRDTGGVAAVLDRGEQREWGIDHERSGELVLVSEPGSWFAYHYWLDEARRPDFAPTVDIHRKPGYDPTELFLDPGLQFPKLRIAKNLLKKKLGFRYLMDVISTDPTQVRGSHGRLPTDPDAGPVFVSSATQGAADTISALEVGDLILRGIADP